MTSEEDIMEFMRKEILPEDYKVSPSLKKKLLQIAKHGVLNEAPDSAVGWIALELIDSDLDDGEKVKLIKSALLKYLTDRSIFVHPKDLPYHRLVGFIMKHEGFDKKYLQYLLVADRLTTIEEIAGNFAEIFGSDMLSDEEKIVCLIGADMVAGRRRDTARLLTEVMKTFLESSVSLNEKLEVGKLFAENRFRDYAKNLIDIIIVGNIERSEKITLRNLPVPHLSLCEEIKNAFGTQPRMPFWYDGGAIRYACRWHVSMLNEREREKFVMKVMESSNPTRDKYVVMGVCDALYYDTYDRVFTRKALEKGLKITGGIIRSLCYEYLFLLYDDIEDYVKKSLYDSDMKVQNTLARVALSPSRLKERNHGKKVQLINLVERYKVDLNKRQGGRLRKLKEELR